MDIKGSGKKEKDAPTPFNTPRNSAPIQGGGKKGGAQQPVGSFTGSFELPSHIQQAVSAHPGLAQIVGEKLSSIVGMSTGFPDTFPAPVRRRLNALKNIQDKQVELEAKFREEILALEAKYVELYRPFHSKRSEIIIGKTEPTEDESQREGSEIEDEMARASIDDEEPEEPKGGKGKGGKGGKGGKDKKTKAKEEIKGIPEFWSTALRNHPLIAETIQEHDLDILKHLEDITVKYIENNMAFVLEFFFSTNQYFNNKSLTKTYYLQNNVSPAFDDVIYSRAEGCTIDWKQGKDVTVKIETKKQKNKANKKTRIVKKTVPQDSFFRFFSPPAIPEEGEQEEEPEEDEEQGMSVADKIDMDFEVGEVIKAKIIARAVDWFTGEALEYEDEGGYMDDEYDEDDMYGEEGDEEDDDAGGRPRRIKGGDDEDDDEEEEDDDDEDQSSAPAAGGQAAAKPGEKPAECAQQ